MAAARYFFAVVKLLLQGGSDVAIACAHLAAQSLKCVLKAYLSKVGIPVIDLKNRYAHDLQALWVEAVAKGLTELPQPPDWCVILNQTHNKPYHLRYPLDINGFSIPAFSVVVPALSRPTSCINIAERDLQMQERSAFEPNNNVSFKVHRELTPDCNIFRHARNF